MVNVRGMTLNRHNKIYVMDQLSKQTHFEGTNLSGLLPEGERGEGPCPGEKESELAGEGRDSVGLLPPLSGRV